MGKSPLTQRFLITNIGLDRGHKNNAHSISMRGHKASGSIVTHITLKNKGLLSPTYIQTDDIKTKLNGHA